MRAVVSGASIALSVIALTGLLEAVRDYSSGVVVFGWRLFLTITLCVWSATERSK